MIRFRKIGIWIFLICFVLLLLSTNSLKRSPWISAEQFLVEMTASVQKFLDRTIDVTEKIWLKYFFLVNLHEEINELRRENDALRMENSRYKEMVAAPRRLRELLGFKREINRSVLPAQVTGMDPSGWFRSIVIDKGSKLGVRLNMPVVNARGVVGRVVSVSPNYAKVLLIVDQNSAVDCLVQRSRDRGMVKGLTNEQCKFDYVVKSSDVLTGDVVVTSGLGGVFPKGLLVGKVLDVTEKEGELFKEILVTPSVDFSRLEEVLVILR